MGITRRGITSDLLPFVEAQLGITGLQVAYQPIFDLQTTQVFAYEALMRSPDARFKDPPSVISGSIAQNVCGELGRLMRQLATQGCHSYPLFLNVHPAEFEDGWMVRPDDPIFQHEEPVYLEITESVPLSHESYCRGTLAEVRTKGVRLAVDDLGAGYSNLLYIADLEPEIVKLDRGLTRAIRSGPRQKRFITSVIHLCRDMGADVVAEGIETMEELEAMREAGAKYGQGYLLGRPGAYESHDAISVFGA